MASAYAIGVGGTMVLGYKVTRCSMRIQRNQAYAMCSVSGDVVVAVPIDGVVNAKSTSGYDRISSVSLSSNWTAKLGRSHAGGSHGELVSPKMPEYA